MDFSAIITEYIKPELLILIPLLFALGMGFKSAKTFPDNKIPLALGIIGVVMAGLWFCGSAMPTTFAEILLTIFTSICHGVICAAVAVYGDQIWKQRNKGDTYAFTSAQLQAIAKAMGLSSDPDGAAQAIIDAINATTSS